MTDALKSACRVVHERLAAPEELAKALGTVIDRPLADRIRVKPANPALAEATIMTTDGRLEFVEVSLARPITLKALSAVFGKPRSEHPLVDSDYKDVTFDVRVKGRLICTIDARVLGSGTRTSEVTIFPERPE